MSKLPGAGPTGDATVIELPAPAPAVEDEDSSPYRRLAADLRGAIRLGYLRSGDPLPTEKDLAQRYGVAVSTAHRATSLLADDDVVTTSRGRRAIVK